MANEQTIAKKGTSVVFKKRALLLIIAAVLLASAPPAYSAPVAGTTVVADVPNALALTVPANLSVPVVVGTRSGSDLTILVHANCPWTMRVEKNTDLSDGSGGLIPSDRFVFQSEMAPFGIGVPQSTDTVFGPTGRGSSVVDNGTRTGNDGVAVTVHYKLATDFNDASGLYTAVHTYTATTP